jgi:hypothetical protein
VGILNNQVYPFIRNECRENNIKVQPGQNVLATISSDQTCGSGQQF